MELLQLRYFRTVAKLEHMTKAAQELRIAQPALSMTIARLEENIGVPLFDRGGGRIRLNRYGQAYLEKVEKALLLLEEGRQEVSEMAGLEHGSIHLATSTMEHLSEPISEFVALHPEVQFRITQTATEQLAQLVVGGEADICFTALPVEHPELAQSVALRENIYLAVPKHHRLAGRGSIRLSEAANEPFIGYKEGGFFQQMNDGFLREAGITPNYVCRVDEPPTVVSLVHAGLGVALYGCKWAAQDGLILLPIEFPVCQREFRIVWHKNRYFSLAARKFRDFIVQYFADRNPHGSQQIDRA